MDDEPRGNGIDEVYFAALERQDAAARAAYLDEACGADTDLRRRVERLLEARSERGSFLETPAVGPTIAADEGPGPEGPGAVIGPYKLLEVIGEGGMGVVYMAEQARPVRRKVALKVIKPGMDSKPVIARFEAERQALALMDHPNIARIFDGGVTASGRPYFVMELVKGLPITEYCDLNRLTPRQRLELFVPVCQAVQHAHQKGIIHRDLKPSNVLVSTHDVVPVVKVIDFGVAKALGQELTDRTLFTGFAQMIGTPLYMSPEQAGQSALDADTRSDVYTLGVLLYELLTGTTPFDKERFRKAAFDEIRRIVREEEPPRPSTRLSESGPALSTISALRQMEPVKLAKLVRGELDWIVMKCLEKDRDRRYQTASGLAIDVQRYLTDEPVLACPPSASYRLRKFARKHRAALATSGAFALLLLAATTASVGLALWANRERVRAVKAETSAKQLQRRAQDGERMAVAAVRRYSEVVRDTPELKNDPGLARLRATLLKEPQTFFKRLRDRLEVDRPSTPDSLARLAAASFGLAELTNEIGDKRDALRAFEESRAIFERLARENPSVAQFQSDLASTHNNIGRLQRDTGRPADALASHERARDILERLTREAPPVIQLRQLAWAHYNIGILQWEAGRPAEALTSCERARDIQERLVSGDPSVTRHWSDLSSILNSIGVLHRDMGRPVEALASHERARDIQERLTSDNPTDTVFRNDLANSHNNIGILQSATGRPTAEALASCERARAILERLASDNPSVTAFQKDLASTLNNIGVLQGESDGPAEALASHGRALEIQERLASENSSVTRLQSELADTLNNIGNLQRRTRRPAEALASHERARVIRERLAREHPESPEFASSLGASLSNMALVDLDEQRVDEARAMLTRAIEWQRKALAAYPDHPVYRQFLANHLENLIRAAEASGREDEAAEIKRKLAVLRNSDPRILALDARLTAVLKGKDKPKDAAERLRLAYRAYDKALFAASARLFGEALKNDPKLRDDPRALHGYNAACSASLAASGKGEDDPPPDGATKDELRRQAREWLQGELSAWAKVLDAGPADARAQISTTLQHWKADPDLAGLREEGELAKLAEQERAALRRLWADVDGLLARAESAGRRWPKTP